MNEEEKLIEKLRKIEALFANPGTEGERLAAGAALERIKNRLEHVRRSEPAIEFRFSMPDLWSRSLFTALVRRYGLEPFRYHGQRRPTVMVPRSFMEQTLWPEFQQLNKTLRHHLDGATKRVIVTAISRDISDVVERTEG